MATRWRRRMWSRDSLVRRIDRCYLIAAGTRLPEKRQRHLAMARYYRALLARILPGKSGKVITV